MRELKTEKEGDAGCFIISSDNYTQREAKYMSTYNLQPHPGACQLAVTSQTSGQAHLLTQNSWPFSRLNDCTFNCACVPGGNGRWGVRVATITFTFGSVPRSRTWQHHYWRDTVWDSLLRCKAFYLFIFYLGKTESSLKQIQIYLHRRM